MAGLKGFVSSRRRILSGLLLLLFAGLGIWRSLPSPLFASPLSTIVLARDGTLLGARIADDGQWRFPAGGRVSEKFYDALVEYEDRRFRYHPGIDPLAVARAIRLNVSEQHVVSGASTITMQVIRLARGNQERSYSEKLIEMLLAMRLELQYSKQEIFELYAANAPFGGNVVGLEAAAWRYFGRDPQQLSWAEACTLAVLPNSPALIHPGRNRQLLLEKRNRLLQRLHEDGYLQEVELKLALAEPLPDRPLPLPQVAPHLLDTLRALHPGVHRFNTTIDAGLQRAATEIVHEHARQLARQDIHNAAALIVDNRNFEVLAYVGNPEYSANNEWGYSVDIIRRPRSSGSILKPFLFASMLDAGEILPGTLISDVPTHYGGYMPENYDHKYRGAVPAEVALAESLNVPAVRMLKLHGVQRFYDFMRQLGMTSLTRRPDDYGLSLILGGAEVSPWEVAGFYANLSNIARAPHAGDEKYQPLRVWDRDKGSEVKAEISPGAAWLTLRALLEVTRPGEEGYWRNFASSHMISWKTGTSWGLRDAWAVGNTGHYTIAVWSGNASGEGRPGLVGGVVAAPILFDLFNRVKPASWFSMPEFDLKEVEVCKDDGFLANGACEKTRQLAPLKSNFERVSKHNIRVHLDRSGRYRVHSGCESISAIVNTDWFQLPPAQESYFRHYHPDYRLLPPLRKDCALSAGAGGGKLPLDLVYPDPGAKLYIPIDLDEQKGRTVFEAVHRDRNAVIYWHLDDHYLGSTRTFHQMALDAPLGHHVITIVDQDGNRVSRNFEVLSED